MALYKFYFDLICNGYLL